MKICADLAAIGQTLMMMHEFMIGFLGSMTFSADGNYSDLIFGEFSFARQYCELGCLLAGWCALLFFIFFGYCRRFVH